jgi:hypothetical protein
MSVVYGVCLIPLRLFGCDKNRFSISCSIESIQIDNGLEDKNTFVNIAAIVEVKFKFIVDLFFLLDFLYLHPGFALTHRKNT